MSSLLTLDKKTQTALLDGVAALAGFFVVQTREKT